MVMRLVRESVFKMNEEELRKKFPYGKVGVHYAIDSRNHSITHVLALRNEVLKDYPNMKDCDMNVCTVARGSTIRFGDITTLFVTIPIDDYLKLRKENKIEIR